MEMYALIKEAGITKKITDAEVKSVINETVRSAMLSIINKIIIKNGDYYIVRPEDIDEFSSGICSNFANFFLKKIINYQKPTYNNYVLATDYNKIMASELIKIVLNYPIQINIDINNFDFALKELGKIKVKDSNESDSLTHQCGRCEDLSPLSCKKAEYYKKPIDEYSFITDGYQTYFIENDGLYLDKFIVQGCRHFKKTVGTFEYYSKPKVKRKKY